MSSLHSLRTFINERLTFAAEEILGMFEKTIVVYEEEIVRQNRLLEILLKPEIKLHRTELPRQSVCEEEVLSGPQSSKQEKNSILDQVDPGPPFINADQQELCTSQGGEQLVLQQEGLPQSSVCKEEVLLDQQHSHQERNSSVSQECPDPPQFKEEQGERCTSQEEGQFVLKQEAKVTLSFDGSDQSEDQLMLLHPEQTNAEEEAPLASIQCEWVTYDSDRQSSVVSEPNGDHMLFSNSSHVAESQDHRTYSRGNTGSSRVQQELTIKPFKCDSCSECFRNYSELKTHISTHTGEKPFKCKVCGRGFSAQRYVSQHMRTHTGEKPYTCSFCGKKFGCVSNVKDHVRLHTGEKPYSCTYCGKDFAHKSHLIKHHRKHTGEKPYTCNICGNSFTQSYHLKQHLIKHREQR